ncbi:unnamed protein product [Phytophthora fragariaefolia]|uniref:Unnamed protein product n=1 Tax=Phytophthora fragariaefolia TaxID=1490495 RepID=A0A9W6XXY5_9STRA|nr:unnamed protein product [Phytophthora fragariaefolia]
MHRTTASRMTRAVVDVTALQEEHGGTLGPIAAHHVAVHHVRQPDGTVLTIPTDNTTRQAQALDDELLRLEQHQDESKADEDCELEVQMFGSWVKIPVRVSSLRAALRLPQHDIFSRGIVHGFTPEVAEPSGEDVPDSDHTATN